MMGFEKPTPIQEQAIPAILNNKDVITALKLEQEEQLHLYLSLINYVSKHI